MFGINRQIKETKKFELMLRASKSFDKVTRIISSCKTQKQLEVAKRTVHNFNRMFYKSQHLLDMLYVRSGIVK